MPLSFIQRLRFAYIDYLLCIKGRLIRADLALAFEISEMQAGVDLRRYKKLYPNRMFYDRFERCHRPEPYSVPHFTSDEMEAAYKAVEAFSLMGAA